MRRPRLRRIDRVRRMTIILAPQVYTIIEQTTRGVVAAYRAAWRVQ